MKFSSCDLSIDQKLFAELKKYTLWGLKYRES
jgi:hypothetical protein